MRTAGALKDQSAGGPDDKQIDEARELASREMRSLVGAIVYDQTLSYDGDDADILARRALFTRAESLIACAHLPGVLRSAQMTQKGFVSEIEIGKAITRYGDPVQSREFEQSKRYQATELLGDYIDFGIYNSDNEQIGVRSADNELNLIVL